MLRKYGLVCAIAGSYWFDKGMNNPKYHEMCLGRMREAIDACTEFGFPNVITFTGLAEDIRPDEGIRNCVAGYKNIIGYAEKKKVNITEDDRRDYFGLLPSGWTRFEAGNIEDSIQRKKGL